MLTAVVVQVRADNADVDGQLCLAVQREQSAMLTARGDDEDERQRGPKAYSADTRGVFAFWIDPRSAARICPARVTRSSAARRHNFTNCRRIAQSRGSCNPTSTSCNDPRTTGRGHWARVEHSLLGRR